MNRTSSKNFSIYCSLFLLGISLGMVPSRSIAAEPADPTPALTQIPDEPANPSPALTQPTAAEAASPPETSSETPIVTANTISLTGLTAPSLWWAKEQLADRQKKFGSQLIDTWAAYEGQAGQLGRVDFFVNRQLWSQLDYVERYTFIHEFGTVANSYGYNVRVFNERREFLASYTCNAQPIDSAPVCDTLLDSSGKAGFRSKPTSPLAP